MAAYEAIASTTLSTSASTITFSSIVNTYEHLQIRLYARASNVSTEEYIQLTLNNDSGSNYVFHKVQGDGSTTTASGFTSWASIYVSGHPGTTTNNPFGVAVIDILDYASTNKYTTVRANSGYDRNGGGFAVFNSGLWLNTAAVNRVDLKTTGTNFTAGSVFALYGLRSS
jgi:hypothetical protein